MVLSLRFTAFSVFYLAAIGLFFGHVPFVAAQSYEDEMYEDEMYEDEMYEDDMYMDQGPYGSRRTLGGADIYTTPILAVFKNMDLSPLLMSDTKFDVRKGPALETESKEVFSAGNHALASQLIYGHIAAEYDEAQPSLAKVKFSYLIKQPVWNLRWAVSMAVRGGEDVTDPSPIAAGTGGGYGSEYMDMDMDFGRQQQRDPDEYMDEDMDMDMDMDMGRGRDPRDGRPNGNGESQDQASVPPMLSTDADEQMEKYLGGVATACAAEFDKRFVAGDFGSIFQSEADSKDPKENPDRRTTGSRSPLAAPSMISPSAIALLREVPPATPMWRPGLVFLGVGSSSDMSVVAKADQIDLLLHFDIVLKQQGRQDQTFVQNVSRARLIHVATGKSLIVSKAMDSTEVRQLQSSGRLSDTGKYIEDQMSNLWRAVDRDTKLVPMPKLSPESARRRIGSLLESGGRRSLRTLAEIRLYQSLGLIDSDEAENAYDIVGGPDALMMMHGPREERLEMVRTWAIETLVKEEE